MIWIFSILGVIVLGCAIFVIKRFMLELTFFKNPPDFSIVKHSSLSGQEVYCVKRNGWTWAKYYDGSYHIWRTSYLYLGRFTFRREEPISLTKTEAYDIVKKEQQEYLNSLPPIRTEEIFVDTEELIREPTTREKKFDGKQSNWDSN